MEQVLGLLLPCFCQSRLWGADSWGAPEDHDSSCLYLAELILNVRVLRSVLRWEGQPVRLGPTQSVSAVEGGVHDCPLSLSLGASCS